MGFERWVDYALDVPMYFVKRGEDYIDVSGSSFRDFFEGKNPAMPGERPTLSDWANHLSTIFPEVRLKRYLEMRGADGVPWGRLPALPAFWVGLLYDDDSLDAAWDLVRHWTAAGAAGAARRRAALRLQGADQGPLSVRDRPGMPEACPMQACGGAAASIISAATRAAISSRWSGSSRPARRRPRRCWTSSMAPGTARWNRPIRNTPFRERALPLVGVLSLCFHGICLRAPPSLGILAFGVPARRIFGPFIRRTG